MSNRIEFNGYEVENSNGNLHITRPRIAVTQGDYGADPVGDGTFRMVPSGDVVSYDERCRRLARGESEGGE